MEKIKLNTIKPSDKNPRSITRDKLEGLARSIKEFPEMMKLRPIVVNKDGVILGGNMRYRALKHLKKEVSRYDTTFICEKGWQLWFIGFTVDGSDVNVSIYIDKSMVAWCNDTTDFETFIMIK